MPEKLIKSIIAQPKPQFIRNILVFFYFANFYKTCIKNLNNIEVLLLLIHLIKKVSFISIKVNNKSQIYEKQYSIDSISGIYDNKHLSTTAKQNKLAMLKKMGFYKDK